MKKESQPKRTLQKKRALSKPKMLRLPLRKLRKVVSLTEGPNRWGFPRAIIRYFKNGSVRMMTKTLSTLKIKHFLSSQDQMLNWTHHPLDNILSLKIKITERLIPNTCKDALKLSRMRLRLLQMQTPTLDSQSVRKLISQK